MPSSTKQLELVRTTDANNPNLHDLKLTNGRLVFFEGTSAIGQRVSTQLSFIQGEWYQNQLEGFPYYREVLIKNPSLVAIKELIRSVIQGTEGIAIVDKVEVSIDENRALTVAFSATTDDGAQIGYSDFTVGSRLWQIS